MRPAQNSDVFTAALGALDPSHQPSAMAWAGVVIRPITPHAAVTKTLVLGGADDTEAAIERVWEFAAESAPRHWRVGSHSSIKMRALAVCAALQTASPPLAGSGDGPAPHREPVPISRRIRAMAEAEDGILVAVEPSSTSKAGGVIARALLTAFWSDSEQPASLRVALTAQGSCARCAISALRRVLETRLLLDPAPTALTDDGPVMRWLADPQAGRR